MGRYRKNNNRSEEEKKKLREKTDASVAALAAQREKANLGPKYNISISKKVNSDRQKTGQSFRDWCEDARQMTQEQSDDTWVKLCDSDLDAIDLIKSYLIHYVDEGFYWRPQLRLEDQSDEGEPSERDLLQDQDDSNEQDSDEDVQGYSRVRTVNSLFTVLREWQNLVGNADDQYLAKRRARVTDWREREHWKLKYQGKKPHGHDAVWEVTSWISTTLASDKGLAKTTQHKKVQTSAADLVMLLNVLHEQADRMDSSSAKLHSWHCKTLIAGITGCRGGCLDKLRYKDFEIGLIRDRADPQSGRLELTLTIHILGEWDLDLEPSSLDGVSKIPKLPNLTTLVIPWSQLGMAGRLPGEVDTSKVQTLEVQLVHQCFPFGHDLILFVTDPKIKKSFPSLHLLKITVREPGNKKWHVTIKLIMEYMEAETADGTFLGCPIVKSDPSHPACVVDGSFVMDFSELLRELLLHDSG